MVSRNFFPFTVRCACMNNKSSTAGVLSQKQKTNIQMTFTHKVHCSRRSHCTLTFSNGEPLIFHRRAPGVLSRDWAETQDSSIRHEHVFLASVPPASKSKNNPDLDSNSTLTTYLMCLLVLLVKEGQGESNHRARRWLIYRHLNPSATLLVSIQPHSCSEWRKKASHEQATCVLPMHAQLKGGGAERAQRWKSSPSG